MLLEDYVRLHGDKLRALEPDTELTRKLAGWCEVRRALVDERTRARRTSRTQIVSAMRTAPIVSGRTWERPR